MLADLRTEERALNVLLDLQRIVRNEVKPFPYGDVWALDRSGIEVGSLVPDLSMYCANIWGLCSWGRKAFRWESEGWPRARVEYILATSFYQKYPEYNFLEKEINNRDLKGLKTEIDDTENMRVLLLSVLDDIYQAGME